ncbi:arsenate reductase family protein [Bdellovibrio sp. HCB337]|uniref:arsenate reductase family protein n=1 Tax=Bdellovibrio sp. HCB337 TaxID=3394358 RepID=UPI0039A6E001
MSSVKVYEYAGCSTCKKALKFLETKKVKFQKIAIVDQPPTKVELKSMLQFLKEDGGDLKKLFNTSGVLYKEMKISEKFPTMSEADALDLLAKHGKLIKRPFVLGKDFGMVGFKEDQWKKHF